MLDVPIYKLIGGSFREKIGAYANGWYQTDRAPEAFAAKVHNIMVAPHNAMEPVGTAAALHVGASTSNIMIQEVFEDFATPLAAKIADHPIVIENGEIAVPQKPGCTRTMKPIFWTCTVTADGRNAQGTERWTRPGRAY